MDGKRASHDPSLRSLPAKLQHTANAVKNTPARQRKLMSLNTAQNSSSLWPATRNTYKATGISSTNPDECTKALSRLKPKTSPAISRQLSTKEHNMDFRRNAEKRIAHDRRGKSPLTLSSKITTSRNSSKSSSSNEKTSVSDTESSPDSMSDFIVSDSASESELQKPPRSMRKKAPNSFKRPFRNRRPIISDSEEEESSNSTIEHDFVRATKIQKDSLPGNVPTLYHELSKDQFSEDGMSKKFSKPKQTATKTQAPREALTIYTPPTSPSKPRLQSPRKSRIEIPQSPHRKSVDAFWTQDVINEWNESFSPQKVQKVKIFPPTSSELLLPGSPIRQTLFSPNSKTKAVVQEKRDFDAKKHSIAAAFLADLDRVVTGNQLSALSADTGGVKIVWSKTLNSTAGRAKWQREAIRTISTVSNSATQVTTYKHHASIELAIKVIDNEDRLLNVLAHEFCHLANFMVSNVKDQPHGKSFQDWAAKVTSSFPHKDIHVTTKHSYKIDYKYIWNCTDCGIEYKRHSKSVDPLRHACSVCKGKLVQTKPVPRNNADPHGNKTPKRSAYQDFVKKWYVIVQQEHQEWKMKDIMSELAKRYRVEKGACGAAAATMDTMADKENLAQVQVDLVVISSEDEKDCREADSLGRRLNHLTLG